MRILNLLFSPTNTRFALKCILVALVIQVFGPRVIISKSHAEEPPSAPKVISLINKCQKISVSGSYALTRNLPSLSGLVDGHCLIVTADFVTIDLSGFVIDGTEAEGHGIYDAETIRRAIVVRDGTITGFSDGVHLGGFTDQINDVLIENIRAIGNAAGIVVAGSAIITRNFVSENRDIGINVGVGSNVTKNIVRSNGDKGIFAQSGANISDNIVIFNGGDGIMVSDTSIVTRNVVRFNGGFGVRGGPIIVDSNIFSGNPGGAIKTGCPFSIITRNMLRGNGSPLLSLDGIGCILANNSPPQGVP